MDKIKYWGQRWLGWGSKTPPHTALTRILKTGVQDSHLTKSTNSTGKSGNLSNFLHFLWEWYVWIILDGLIFTSVDSPFWHAMNCIIWGVTCYTFQIKLYLCFSEDPSTIFVLLNSVDPDEMLHYWFSLFAKYSYRNPYFILNLEVLTFGPKIKKNVCLIFVPTPTPNF